MFEGARRIAILLGALAVVVTVATVALDTPYVSLTYAVRAPGAPFIRSDESCPSEALSKYMSVSTTSGRSASVTLCVPTMLFENGAALIPYKIDEEGMVWGAAKYSPEVMAYERELEQRFRLPANDVKYLEEQITKARWRNAKEAAKYLAIGLAIWAAVVSVIGWIVRGFLGIPNGMDRRPEQPAA
jgi:hypothetical protein